MQLMISMALKKFYCILLFFLIVGCTTLVKNYSLSLKKTSLYLPSVMENALLPNFKENTIPLTKSEIVYHSKYLKSGFIEFLKEESEKQKKDFIKSYFSSYAIWLDSNLEWIENVYKRNFDLESEIYFPRLPESYENQNFLYAEKLSHFLKLSKQEVERIKEEEDWYLLIDNLQMTWEWIEKFYTENYISNKKEREFRKELDNYYLNATDKGDRWCYYKPCEILLEIDRISDKIDFSKEELIDWLDAFNNIFESLFLWYSDDHENSRIRSNLSLEGFEKTLKLLESLLPKLKKKENSLSNLIPIFRKIHEGEEITFYHYAILTDFLSSDFSSYIRKIDKKRDSYSPFDWISKLSEELNNGISFSKEKT